MQSHLRQRVDNLVGFGAESVWVSTFHSACVRILRRFIDRLGYENHFTIYDTDDQKTLIKEVCRKVDVDTKVFKERSLLSAISSAKNEMILPDEFELNAGGDFAKMKIAKVYREYEAQMRANNALDFDDLLVKTVQLLPSLLQTAPPGHSLIPITLLCSNLYMQSLQESSTFFIFFTFVIVYNF